MALRWQKLGGSYEPSYEASAEEGDYTINANREQGSRKIRYDLYMTHRGHVGTGFQTAHMGWFRSLVKAKARAAYYHKNVILD